ncbi:PREDICTED: nephrocystin-1-like [Priapulus caudatus]|uniref:Nephrocystin-1-like n=1 Tax=Priapulus caudatus TaxID=37621 RepID=A0ABM1EHX0_PRICU|nr:PREDICTED: nephrocystin-1-like [Priapulus caudatus]
MASEKVQNLKQTRKDYGSLQKQFLALSNDFQLYQKSVIADGGHETVKAKKLYESCLKLKTTVSITIQKAAKIETKKEAQKKEKDVLVTDFEKLLGNIDALAKKLEPDPVEDEYFRKASTEGFDENDSSNGEDIEASSEEGEAEGQVGDDGEEASSGDSDEDVSVEESQDEDEEEEEEEGEPEVDDEQHSDGSHQSINVHLFEAVANFEGQQKEDLSIKVGDVLALITARDDGWWLMENNKQETGLVPSTYLKVVDQDKVEDTKDRPQSKSSALWRNIKQAVAETSVTDVLSAFGAIPAGCRPSMLGKVLSEGQHTVASYLVPKLSASHAGFRDLFWNQNSNKIRQRALRLLRMITIVSCRRIPFIGRAQNLDVTSRHVRLCLFDGSKILSNIHTVRATFTENRSTTWSFPSRPNHLPSDEEPTCFLRSSDMSRTLGALLELGISFIRKSTGEEGELSCGWVHLPLFDEHGTSLHSKSYELLVHGGTPFEKGVEVDPSVSRREEFNPLRTLLSGSKQPRLVVRLSSPSKDQKVILNTLPDVLVAPLGYLHFVSFYRQLLAEALLCDRTRMDSAELIHSPLLSTFSSAVGVPDLMDALQVVWAERVKTTPRSEKRDAEHMRELFVTVYMETVYPLLHNASLVCSRFDDHNSTEARREEISKHVKKVKESRVLASLLSSDSQFEPLDVSELAFDLLSHHLKS